MDLVKDSLTSKIILKILLRSLLVFSTIISVGSSKRNLLMPSSSIIESINKENNYSFDTSILERITGIASRSTSSEEEHPSTLAVEASMAALNRAGLSASAIDTIIFASASTDILTPATANIVADNLSISPPCFDVSNACNSFMNGLHIASLLVDSGSASLVLVCTGEVSTKGMRYSFPDETSFTKHFTGFTLGDGGAAVLVGRSETKSFETFNSKSFPHFWRDSGIFAGGSRNLRKSDHGFFQGDPQKLKDNTKYVTDYYSSFILDDLKAKKMSIEDFRFVLTHQVTVKYRDLFYKQLGCTAEQTVPIVEIRGNITSASVPTQLDLVWDSIEKDDKILMASVGGGMSAGYLIWTKK